MISSTLFTTFLLFGFFWLNNADNEKLRCSTCKKLVSQIHFDPGVKNSPQDIRVEGKTPFTDCTTDGSIDGTGTLVINNQSISFSCFNIFTHSLNASFYFSLDDNKQHNVTLIPQGLLKNFGSFFLAVTYTGKLYPKLYNADQLKVVFVYRKNLPNADPALTCFDPGLIGLNGTATLTLK